MEGLDFQRFPMILILWWFMMRKMFGGVFQCIHWNVTSIWLAKCLGNYRILATLGGADHFLLVWGEQATK
jgi:hypothetical protein